MARQTYTNQLNIPLPLAVFLATDDYDYEPNTISTTSIIKPVKQVILNKRLSQEERVVDISSLINARMGTAIHTAIEQAWKNPNIALKALGYSDKLIERIKINPEKVEETDIPVYMERRSYKEIEGFKISGKFDFVADDQVQDFKSTSVYGYMNQTNKNKYILQGSIYRWLNPDIIKKDYMTIHYVFTDWSKAEANRNADYPQSRMLSQQYPLMTFEETENYIRNKLKQIKRYENVHENEIPQCTDEDLWRKPTLYKYFKDPNKTSRSTKNFDNKNEAYQRLYEDGNVGLVQEVKGQVSACRYCPALAICEQAQQLIQSGDLIV